LFLIRCFIVEVAPSILNQPELFRIDLGGLNSK